MKTKVKRKRLQKIRIKGGMRRRGEGVVISEFKKPIRIDNLIYRFEFNGKIKQLPLFSILRESTIFGLGLKLTKS